MKIGIICNQPFQLLTVFQRPLGNPEAAATYLAIELTKLGHEVTFYSNTSSKIGAFDIRCRGISIVGKDLHLDKTILEQDFDVLIIKNQPVELAAFLRKGLKYNPRIYLWTSLDPKSPENEHLDNTQVIDAYNGIVCSSKWLSKALHNTYTNIPNEKLSVKMYGITPLFENMYTSDKEFLHEKSKEPSLTYTSGPLLGLEVLINSFIDVQGTYPESSLHIYSGMHAYGDEKDKLENIYSKARKIKGLDHLGSVSTTTLCAKIRPHTILAYPTTANITNCVSMMDAMAAGLYVITTNIAAMPEYSLGKGKLISPDILESASLDNFSSQLLAICQTQAREPNKFFAYCYKQMQEVNAKHTWRVRAREWIQWLNTENT